MGKFRNINLNGRFSRGYLNLTFRTLNQNFNNFKSINVSKNMVFYAGGRGWGIMGSISTENVIS